MTADEFVHLIANRPGCEPYDEYSACPFCGTAWAEDTYEEWRRREALAFSRDHHDSDCIWVLANQVEMSR